MAAPWQVQAGNRKKGAAREQAIVEMGLLLEQSELRNRMLLQGMVPAAGASGAAPFGKGAGGKGAGGAKGKGKGKGPSLSLGAPDATNADRCTVCGKWSFKAHGRTKCGVRHTPGGPVCGGAWVGQPVPPIPGAPPAGLPAGKPW